MTCRTVSGLMMLSESMVTKNSPCALGEAGVEALFLAPVFGEADGLDELGVALLGPVDVSPGVVLGAVVDADDLQPVGRVVGGGRGVDGLFHHGPFVVSRDDDRHPGQGPWGSG